MAANACVSCVDTLVQVYDVKKNYQKTSSFFMVHSLSHHVEHIVNGHTGVQKNRVVFINKR